MSTDLGRSTVDSSASIRPLALMALSASGVLMAAVWPAQAEITEFAWKSGRTGSWADADNWMPAGGPPRTLEHWARIDGDDDKTITMDREVSIFRLTALGGAKGRLKIHETTFSVSSDAEANSELVVELKKATLAGKRHLYNNVEVIGGKSMITAEETILVNMTIAESAEIVAGEGSSVHLGGECKFLGTMKVMDGATLFLGNPVIAGATPGSIGSPVLVTGGGTQLYLRQGAMMKGAVRLYGGQDDAPMFFRGEDDIGPAASFTFGNLTADEPEDTWVESDQGVSNSGTFSLTGHYTLLDLKGKPFGNGGQVFFTDRAGDTSPEAKVMAATLRNGRDGRIEVVSRNAVIGDEADAANPIDHENFGRMYVRGSLEMRGSSFKNYERGFVAGRSIDVTNLASQKIENAGVFTPSLDGLRGVLTIVGDYEQLETGVLSVTLSGPVPGVSYDVLDVRGAADLSGLLEVLLSPGYEPTPGQEFYVLQCDDPFSSMSRFSAVQSPPWIEFSDRYEYVPSLGRHAVILRVESVPAPASLAVGLAVLLGVGRCRPQGNRL